LDRAPGCTAETPGDGVSGSPQDDEALIVLARGGDESALSALLLRYRGFARAKARAYFLVGADHEDIVQEAMIGLYKAIRDYRTDRESSFRNFAELCITRQVITAISGSARGVEMKKAFVQAVQILLGDTLLPALYRAPVLDVRDVKHQLRAALMADAEPVARSRAASASVSGWPIGFVGMASAGSYRSTRVWVISVATSRRTRADARAFCSDCCSM